MKGPELAAEVGDKKWRFAFARWFAALRCVDCRIRTSRRSVGRCHLSNMVKNARAAIFQAHELARECEWNCGATALVDHL